jgi:hypothetical protein
MVEYFLIVDILVCVTNLRNVFKIDIRGLVVNILTKNQVMVGG